MNRYIAIFCFFLFSTCFYAQNDTIFKIFDKMCLSLQVEKSKRPKLEIRNTASSGASYSKLSHTIYIDQKLIDAFDQFRQQKSLALAFVIGHELSHALEKDRHDTHFLAYDRAQGATYQNEQNADIQGAFIAYISGYNVLPNISETIEALYTQYHLLPHLKGYPDKADRIESIGLVREQVESLITLFKSSNLLLIDEEYSLAASIFKHIDQYYPSPEISSNIAVAQILEAINLGKYNYFRYTLPIEVSWELRLKKPGVDLGQKDFEPEISRHRELLLKKSDILLKEAIALYPSSFSLWNNLICLKLILNDLSSALSIYKSASSKFRGRYEKEQLQVLSGILYLIQGKEAEAMKNFKEVQSPWLNTIIRENMNHAQERPALQPCTPETVSIPAGKNSLLQEKKISLDTITISWTKERIKIHTPSKFINFQIIQLKSPVNCMPGKSLDQNGIKWSSSLLSIFSPTDRKSTFYTVN